MRTYTPHHFDALAAKQALDAIYAGRLTATADELSALNQVRFAARSGDTVTQHCICRAHDVIDRMHRIT